MVNLLVTKIKSFRKNIAAVI